MSRFFIPGILVGDSAEPTFPHPVIASMSSGLLFLRDDISFFLRSHLDSKML